MPHVADDADDPSVAIGLDDLPKSILAGQERPRHGFVYHDDLLARRRVPLGEIAAVAQWNSHGSEVAIAHYAHKRIGIVTRQVRFPLDADTPTAVAAERKRTRPPG